jgi:hypothetical protein
MDISEILKAAIESEVKKMLDKPLKELVEIYVEAHKHKSENKKPMKERIAPMLLLQAFAENDYSLKRYIVGATVNRINGDGYRVVEPMFDWQDKKLVKNDLENPNDVSIW